MIFPWKELPDRQEYYQAAHFASSVCDDLSTVKTASSQTAGASTDRQAIHQPVRPPVIPPTGLVLNLCPALMNEPIPALRYEVAGHLDETQSYRGCSNSSSRTGERRINTAGPPLQRLPLWFRSDVGEG
ncbi:hypothetical protein FQN60_018490 [Etheostoma spectabile]|uniref:Uncharacterized protein n=1 Tax=Etheostoma spectabile TaxID=54343 RepID=A0A5J5DI48_9PERO|nr:hypothetical protein FQN60_018490 [Etheostoma spectabile]